MRHALLRHKLNRRTTWHDATVTALAKNVLIRERIVTTKVKARAALPLVEKLIGLGKKDSLYARRQAYKLLGEHALVSLLFKDIATRFSDRTGGYARILGFGRRRGDNAELVLLELTQIKKKEKKPKKEKAKEERPEEKQPVKETIAEEKKPKAETALAEKEKEKRPTTKKPDKKFLGGLRNIFKKERRDASS